MADHGVVFASDGSPRSAWTWHGKESCSFVMAIEPASAVVHLDDTLTADQLATLAHALVTSPEIGASYVRERLEIPPDVQAQSGEALAYRPAVQRVVSRAPGGRETLLHDFKAPE